MLLHVMVQKFLVLAMVYYFMLIIAKNIFLVLGEGDTFGINQSFDAPEKTFNINFSKAKIQNSA